MENGEAVTEKGRGGGAEKKTETEKGREGDRKRQTGTESGQQRMEGLVGKGDRQTDR